MCREPTLSEEVSFVVMTDQKDSDDDDIQVKVCLFCLLDVIPPVAQWFRGGGAATADYCTKCVRLWRLSLLEN